MKISKILLTDNYKILKEYVTFKKANGEDDYLLKIAKELIEAIEFELYGIEVIK